MGSAEPLAGKMDEKLTSRKHAKKQFSIVMLYFDHIFSDILQNAPFRSQIFQIFFASGGKGALFPLTKILRTFLAACVLGSAIWFAFVQRFS